MEPALESQLLGGEDAVGGHCLMIKADEMIHAQAVDVRVIGMPLLGEVLAQIVSVCADGIRKLGKR